MVKLPTQYNEYNTVFLILPIFFLHVNASFYGFYYTVTEYKHRGDYQLTWARVFHIHVKINQISTIF